MSRELEMLESEWLAVARQQSKGLASALADRPAPFDWSRTERRRLSKPSARLAAAAAALLLLGGSVTWAFISERTRQPKTGPSLGQQLHERAMQTGPSPIERAERPKIKRAVERRPRKIEKKARARSQAPASRPAAGPQVERFRGSVIVVMPKGKRKPIFSVKAFKRKR